MLICKEWNKQIFTELLVHEESIRQGLAELAESLTWERMDSRRASCIALYHEGNITDSLENLEALRNWACHTTLVFQSVMEKQVSEILQGSKE